MKFYSTRNRNYRTDLKEAVTRGLAPDQGLFMPEQIVPLPGKFIASLPDLSFHDIALTVSDHLLGDDVSRNDLQEMVAHTLSFDAPAVRVEDDVYSLELFHGPTLAFKDFGARFMSQLLGYYARRQSREIVILVATSGDTGSAVANGFLGVEGTRVVVLYPEGKVSEIQEKQFTTLGQNITALAVQGSFDDCQRMVKNAFRDESLNKKLFLTSANSINVARLIPQSFYYFYGWAQVRRQRPDPIAFAVPSGNFGNLTGGLLAMGLGLPVHAFVACTNINDIVPEYLRTSTFQPRPSLATISNAMDVGNPSNFERMMDLFGHEHERLSKAITGCSFTDDETRQALLDVYKRTGYLMDPHGAVGYLGLKAYLRNHQGIAGIFLETAHPGKFREVVEKAIGETIVLPESLEVFLSRERLSTQMEADDGALRDFLLKNY